MRESDFEWFLALRFFCFVFLGFWWIFEGFIQNLKNVLKFLRSGRERGIRTPGGVTLNGFQDRRFQPLSHLPQKKDKVKKDNQKASEAKT